MIKKNIFFIGFLIIILLLVILLVKNNKNFEKKLSHYIEIIENLDKIQQNNNVDSNINIDIPVLYINLDRSLNRKKIMEKQLSIYSKHFERISAIDGKKIKNKMKDEIDGLKFINYFEHLTVYEIGCTLSHLKAIKKGYDLGYEIFIVMEDDCCCSLSMFWNAKLSDIVKLAPNDWKVLQVCIISNHCKETEAKFKKHNANKPCWSNAAVIYNREGARNILNKVLDQDIFFIRKFDKNNKLISEVGAADYYIYNLANSYYYTLPLFIPLDMMVNSTIHRSHEKVHIISTINTLNNYFKLFPTIEKEILNNKNIMLLQK